MLSPHTKLHYQPAEVIYDKTEITGYNTVKKINKKEEKYASKDALVEFKETDEFQTAVA